MNKAFALLALLLLGFSCASPAATVRETPLAQEVVSDWTKISASTQRRFLRQEKDTSIFQIVVYRIDPMLADFSLHQETPPQRIEAWQKSLSALLVMNGGYFDENYEPTGLFIDEGQNLGSNPYDPAKSGTIVFSPQVNILDTQKQPLPDHFDGDVLQSFPLLIRSGGKPGIEADTQKLARRTVLAKDIDGNMLAIIVDQTPISLFQLMEILLESDLRIDTALNLDGGPSTGLLVKTDSYSESILPLSPLPQVIALTEHPAR